MLNEIAVSTERHLGAPVSPHSPETPGAYHGPPVPSPSVESSGKCRTPPGTRTRNLRIKSPKISVRGVHTPCLSASRRVSASVQSIACGLVR